MIRQKVKQDLDRKNMPFSQEIGNVAVPAVEEMRLHNGIPVHTISLGSQDVVRIDLIFKAGIWDQPQPLVASFTSGMLSEGTKSKNATQLAEAFDFYGSYLKSDSGRHSASVSLYTLTKHLPNTISVFEDVIKNSVFPEEGFNTLLENRRQEYLIGSEKSDTLAFRHFNELLYGEEHPYGKLILSSDFKKLKSASLLNFYHTHYIPQKCEVVVSGKLPKNMLDILNQHFGQKSWREESGEESSALNGSVVEAVYLQGRELFLARHGAKQSSIRIGNASINQLHTDYPKLKIVNTILGGYFGSRLMKNLREQKGYTYGIGSALISAPKAGGFVIATEVGADVTREAIQEIYTEVDKLSQDLVSQDELERVKSYMLGETLRFFDGPFAIADLLRGYLNYGRKLGDYNVNLEAIRDITREEIRELAQAYFNTADFIEVVVGKKK